MNKMLIIFLLFFGLCSCRTRTISYTNNTVTKDSIRTEYNDSTSIVNVRNENTNIKEDKNTLTSEKINEVITDTINNVRIERTIERTITEVAGKTTEQTINEKSDTTYISNETTQQITNNNVTEHIEEKTSWNNVMLFVFLSLLAVVALVVIIKFF